MLTGAYWNIQAENTPGVTWALDVTLDALAGNVNYATSGSAQTYINAATYPVKSLGLNISLVCRSLTTNSWEVFHDGSISRISFQLIQLIKLLQ